ncbi:MAG: hypothetical protein ACO32I_06235 [Candidatus Limnocylindrus sp.]
MMTSLDRIETAIGMARAVRDSEHAPVHARLLAAAAAARWDWAYEDLLSTTSEELPWLFTDSLGVGDFEKVFGLEGWNDDDVEERTDTFGEAYWVPTAAYLAELIEGATFSAWDPDSLL